MQKIRNVAIIAHVDHGKTTLVDKMLLAGNLFRDNQSTGELMLDNNDLERERGITILSKNVSINYNGYKINIIDTPGHSDFGGEVERVLNMADGCLLLVDAFEGPMPQTRFVLQKAIQMGLKPIVVVNKVDKPNCRPDEVQEMVFDLMCNLDATEEQLDFPTIYGSAKQNWMSDDWSKPTDNINAVLDAIIEYIPAPEEIERVRREVKSADGIWFMTAEYNYSYPGILKNLLDWLSRPLYKGASRSDTAIYGKKATISGVGGKNATAGARMKLKELLKFMGVDVMVENETGVSLSPDSFGTNTLDLSKEAMESLKKQVESFLSYIE